MKVSSSALEEVKAALEEYKKAIDDSSLSDVSKKNYVRYPEQFVRWLYDDFEPGLRLR